MKSFNFFLSYLLLYLFRAFGFRSALTKALNLSPFNFHARNDLRADDKLGVLQNRCSLEILNASFPEEAAKAARFFQYCVENHQHSNSQIFQDLFALWVLEKTGPYYFVEFGAVDGIWGSNSLLFEKRFGPNGVIAEPNPRYKDILHRNRKCKIELRCVHSISNSQVTFTDVEDAPELSTMTQYHSADKHSSKRKGSQHTVETVTLMDMLEFHRAPHEMGYLSIDTEGSEFEILKNFNFNRYRFKVVTIEHNHDAVKIDKLVTLLQGFGYKRYLPYISAFDLWFVLER
ncbi:MAG: FkbM family methyltransferase [Bdellovibrionales bacterium]